MSKYHPIDVRYTGPSTSYRGSAKVQPKPDHMAKPVPAKATAQPAAAPKTPWGTKAATPSPRPAPPRARPMPKTSSFGSIGSTIRGIRGVFRTLKYLYFAAIAAVFLFFIWFSPSDQFNGFTAPMNAISTNP